MSKTATLKKGSTYTYQRTKFVRGVPQSVDPATADYLSTVGRFDISGSKAASTKKVKIRKPDTSKVSKPATEEEGIPTFRSKQQLADYAKKEYGVEFEGDIKDLKMTDMKEDILEHIASLDKSESNEPKIEV